jgi:hypothetical protein
MLRLVVASRQLRLTPSSRSPKAEVKTEQMTVLGLLRQSSRVPAKWLEQRLGVVLLQVPERGQERLLLVGLLQGLEQALLQGLEQALLRVLGQGLERWLLQDLGRVLFWVLLQRLDEGKGQKAKCKMAERKAAKEEKGKGEMAKDEKRQTMYEER